MTGVTTCSFDGCDNKSGASRDGLCRGHHDQKRTGQELTPRRKIAPRGTNSGPCSFEACDRQARSHGLCEGHNKQRRKGYELHPLGDQQIKSERRRAYWATMTPDERAARVAPMVAAITGPKTPEHIARIAESNRAGWAARGGVMKPQQRVCRGCGTTFTATGPRQWFCTTECRNLTARLTKYSITRTEYNELMRAQGNGCALCGGQSKGYSLGTGLHIDHCHTTGRVRGLLCGDCNTALGRFGDDPALLRRAAEYLERA